MTSVARVCSVDGCDRGVYARQLCGLHYNRSRKGIPMEMPARPWGSSGCSHRGCDRPYSHNGYCELHARRKERGTDMDAPPKTPSGHLHCQVPNCDKPHESNGMCGTHSYTARKYKMSLEQIRVLENSVCGICGSPAPEYRNLAVDHDHSCCPGKNTCGRCIRGYLCQACNQGLGMFKDDPNLFRRAIAYLSGDLIN